MVCVTNILIVLGVFAGTAVASDQDFIFDEGDQHNPKDDFETIPIHDTKVSRTSRARKDGWKNRKVPPLYKPQYECQPPCQNGGECIGPHSCRCPEHFLGAQCQYKEKSTEQTCSVPPFSANSHKTCASGRDTACTFNCHEGYQFPDGSISLSIHCVAGKWYSKGESVAHITDCEAVCMAGCQNGGKCVSPNTCSCEGNFYGPQCQFEKKPCPKLRPPMNSRMSCSPERCSVTCFEDHKLPDGSREANLNCKDGQWVPAKSSWLTVPDCEAICDPECMNDGICVGVNVCQCTEEFRGPQCQYPTSVCTGRKLKFNGSYRCNGDDYTFNCTLSCPPGMNFESSPAVVYVCQYSDGIFYPPKVPQCVDEYPSNKLDLIFPSNPHIESSRKPRNGECFTWGKDHYKTFDGRVFSFKSNCVYTLATNADNTFHIQTPTLRTECKPANSYCMQVTFYISGREYLLSLDNNGDPIIFHNYKTIRVPVQLPGLRAEILSNSVSVEFQEMGVTLVTDFKDILRVRLTVTQWNQTSGLCGNYDGDFFNDLYVAHNNIKEYASLFRVDKIGGEKCIDDIQDINPYAPENQMKANEFCSKILHERKFELCRNVSQEVNFFKACVWDYSSSSDTLIDPGCKTINMFVEDCKTSGVRVPPWRDEDFCPIRCTGGKVYMECGKEERCGGAKNLGDCEEGCFCPRGKYRHQDSCLSVEHCPCNLHGKSFPPGHTIDKECNTCKCVHGSWSCTPKECSARCMVTGDPHYITFDQRTYDFMGKCSYYLVKMEELSIEVENVPCSGPNKETSVFPLSAVPYLPSCAKSITIKMNETTIKLKQRKVVTVNGEEMSLPLSMKNVYIHDVSSKLLLAEIRGGMQVMWDGLSTVYVEAPAHYRGKTMGLCGTFNGNQKDDFLTPEGDIEQDAVSFANKWKTKDNCDNQVIESARHPCDVNVQNKATALQLCAHIKSTIFENCHYVVQPDIFYEDCLFDMCTCSGDISRCLCPIMAIYAQECAIQGVSINWRPKIRQCGMQCPRGQEYKMCSEPCTRSCQELSRSLDCKNNRCLEGCRCPPGQALDRRDQCIPIAKCSCTHNGFEYLAGHKELRKGAMGNQICKCINAVWDCQPVTSENLKNFSNNTVEESACPAEKNLVYTHCEPSEPVTCQNMHLQKETEHNEAICYGGCVCKMGYILDAISRECVLPKDCPCHHGGKSYKDGRQIQEECNTCVCNSGKWTCTDHICPGICKTWGDAHFKSFDGKIFDFQGTCEYIFSEGKLSDEETFRVTVEIVPCGSSGVSCAKSATLSVGVDEHQETVIFSGSKETPRTTESEKIIIREAGLFLYADVPDLGIVLQWDKGTTVMLRVDPKWKTKLKGLCGNYNDCNNDDFETPGGGGVSEVSAHLFGDSWKLHDYCPEAIIIEDTCEFHPARKAWSIEKCNILKSHLFKMCHTEVPVEPYFQRCTFDACGCDQGGDCECLCTAISAYAQECNSQGVTIKWRTQSLCPMQCDKNKFEYSPCIPTCPPETCDNTLVYNSLTKMCNQDTCVEGCQLKPCPEGQIHKNLTDLECMPKATCKPPCMTENGKQYFEGDIMESDDCHSCYCTRKKMVCKGQPCTTTMKPVILTTLPSRIEENITCIPGWSDWINKHHPIPGLIEEDIESLPTLNDYLFYSGTNYFENTHTSPRCPIDMITDVRCRTVDSHMTTLQTGEDAVCSLSKGLHCENGCQDYEISVLCNCGMTTPEPEIVVVTEYSVCSVNGPLKPHQTDCSLYYQCQETGLGAQWVERKCGPGTWYNTKSMNCEWPYVVMEIRPECETTKKDEGKCKDTWSDWINVSNPEHGIGDIETFNEIKKRKIQLCPNSGFIKDIQCMYQRKTFSKTGYHKKGVLNSEMVDYTKSGDKVTCDTVKGLECLNIDQNYGMCQDYSIRVYCACEGKRTGDIVEEGKGQVRKGCPKGFIKDSCAVQCDRLCHHYEKVSYEDGTCSMGIACKAGCRHENRMLCPPGHRWRDSNTCVQEQDCTCKSHTGEIVKPGIVIKESECEVCQCIDNHYICDKSACFTTKKPIIVTEFVTLSPPEVTGEEVIIPSSLTPPSSCDRSLFIPLLEKLPDSAFRASSTVEDYQPYYARLSNPLGNWKPAIMDSDQYLQIDLGKPDAIYGLTTKGNLEEIEHVNTYYVLYSLDNTAYSYVMFNGMPELFHGSSLNEESMTQVFSIPVEARYIRINPVSWTNEISLKVEIYGCSRSITTALPVTETSVSASTTFIPVCTDKMSAKLNKKQLSVSSAITEVTPEVISVYNNAGWMPLSNSPNEWIQFDFLGERTLTGIMTMGGGSDLFLSGDRSAWVVAYTIKYSQDGHLWNPFLEHDGLEKIFRGNMDDYRVHTNMFGLPIHARYLRLYPQKWHNKIALRLQVVGCYEPYPEITTEVPVITTQAPRDCNICPGATVPDYCICSDLTWWNGETCVKRTECPCFIGFISYAVGTIFDNDKCELCTCTIGGVPQCKPKQCPPCGKFLRKTLTDSCYCQCKPCPEGEVLCPTSDMCIAKSLWCNGFIDCPDDELDCPHPTTSVKPTTIAPTTKAPPKEECPVIKCPEGFLSGIKNISSTLELQEENPPPAPQWSPFGSKSKFSSYFSGGKDGSKSKMAAKGFKGFRKKTSKNIRPVRLTQAPKCPEYVCTPIVIKDKPCPKPSCLEGYELITVKGQKGGCDQYSCVLKKQKLEDGKCNITGRIFNTFDGTEYKYEICDHILARDRLHKDWEIKQIKKCSYVGPCLKYLIIKQGNHTIHFNHDLSTLYDGYNYTVPQLQKIGAQSQEFAIKQVSNTFIIFSSMYEFSIIWDSQANTRIIVPGISQGSVDGLCGFFDGKSENDKQKPNGELAKTSVEFGDSWGESSNCETRVCPVAIQNKAWKICKELKEGPLTKCEGIINMGKMLTQCVETICSCMESNNDTEGCRCQAILDAVTECQRHDSSADLSQWRVVHDCYVKCPEGLVYKECFNRACEVTCSEIMVDDICPLTQECFPGCYCPDGLVKDGDKCISPPECRDCICDSYGQSGFITFDRADFTFSGNCTYVLAQTIENYIGQKFKVLGTSGPCAENPGDVCMNIITIVFREHTVQVINDKNKQIVLRIDGREVNGVLPDENWIKVSDAPGRCLIISLPKIQLDLEFYRKGKGFYLKLPSYLYEGNTEGLCGSCNLNRADDFKMRNGSIADDIQAFGQSWREKELPDVLGKEEKCTFEEPTPSCLPPLPEQDPCLKILNEKLFGKCHAVIDPSVYVASCHMALCKEMVSTCQFLEAYSRECQNENICLDWRSPDLCPYRCPKGLIHQPCGTGCTPTCDNFELLRESPSACTSSPGDTCVCPDAKVLSNGTCLEENRCKPCDLEGHYSGDEWKPDPCTTCSCSDSSVQCQKVQCTDSSSLCRRGFKSILIKSMEGECCPKHMCVPEPTSGPICPEPQQPKCGFGQVMKLETASSGCQEFICQCKPLEECDDISSELEKERLPGMVALVDNSGCCPSVEVVCKVETCPGPPECPQFHIPVRRDTEKCCPEFRCRIPEDKCLYEMEYGEGAQVGDKKLKPLEKYKVLKDVGDQWSDGPCMTCSCKEGSEQASCTTKLCSLPPESKDYLYEPKHVPHKCCPSYKRTACIMGDKVFKVGEILSSGDPCKNYTCIMDPNGEINKQDIVQTCKKNCPLGWEYEKATQSSGKCCGECKPVSCVVNGILYPKESVWKSDDNCATYHCKVENNQIQVITSEEQCPSLEGCHPDRIYQDGCCKKCNTTVTEAQSTCIAENMELDKTIHLIKMTTKDHGTCLNLEYVRGFTECIGTCDSFVKYNNVLGHHESSCTCCQATSFKTIIVPLDCDDGSVLTKELRVPTECSCLTCQAEPNQKPKTKTKNRGY